MPHPEAGRRPVGAASGGFYAYQTFVAPSGSTASTRDEAFVGVSSDGGTHGPTARSRAASTRSESPRPTRRSHPTATSGRLGCLHVQHPAPLGHLYSRIDPSRPQVDVLAQYRRPGERPEADRDLCWRRHRLPRDTIYQRGSRRDLGVLHANPTSTPSGWQTSATQQLMQVTDTACGGTPLSLDTDSSGWAPTRPDTQSRPPERRSASPTTEQRDTASNTGV